MIQRSILRSSTAVQSIQRCIVPRASLQQPAIYLRPAPVPPIFLRSSRWYSDAQTPSQGSGEASAAKSNEAAAGDKTKSEPATEDKHKQELEAKNKEIADLKDKYLRSIADFRNLQERTKREVQQAKDFALQRFSKDFIESIDNFDRALDAVPADKLAKLGTTEPNADLLSLYNGLKNVDEVMHKTLKKYGLERFDPVGEKFNPNMHDATFMTPQPDKEDGTVFHVQQKGFLLNGRVVRAAKVGVVKNS